MNLGAMTYEILCRLLEGKSTELAVVYLRDQHIELTSPVPFTEFLFLLKYSKKLTVRGAIII